MNFICLECELTNISCRILHHLSKKDTFNIQDSTDINKAASQLNQGTILGYIYIHANFSDAFFKRLLQPVDLDLDTINQSTIQVSTYVSIWVVIGYLSNQSLLILSNTGGLINFI